MKKRRLKIIFSKLNQSKKNGDLDKKKFRRLRELYKKIINFISKNRKVIKIGLVAVGIGAIAYYQKDIRKVFVGRFGRIIAKIFSSSNKENVQLPEQADGIGQTKNRRLFTVFGTLLIYFIFSQYNSETSMNVAIANKDVSLSENHSVSPSEWKTWFRLISGLLTIVGLIMPIPGPVGVPLTSFEEFVLILKNALILGGYTGATIQD